MVMNMLTKKVIAVGLVNVGLLAMAVIDHKDKTKVLAKENELAQKEAKLTELYAMALNKMEEQTKKEKELKELKRDIDGVIDGNKDILISMATRMRMDIEEIKKELKK